MNKKTTQIIIIVIAAIIAVGIIGYGIWTKTDKQAKGESTEGLEVYNENVEATKDYATFNEFEGVTFKYPSNYKSVGKANNPIYADPEVGGASVNILKDKIPSSFSFEGYIDASISGIKSQMTVKDEINKQYINLNGKKAAKLEYVAITPNGNVHILQVLIQKNGEAYALTLGSLDKDAEKVATKFDNIIRSFK